MKPHVKSVILELLNVIRETENDDLTGTMQRLVCTYVEDVIPIAVEMMSHLVSSLADPGLGEIDGLQGAVAQSCALTWHLGTG